MKTKYCYIPDVENFNFETRVYFVYVGESKRELAQCRFVDRYACEHGAFWRIYDADTCYFLKTIGYKPFDYDEAASLHIRSLEFDIPAFVGHLQNDDLDLVKVPAYVIRNTMHQLSCLAPSFHIQNYAQRIGKKCLTVPRHNLSHDNMGELVKAAGNFCLILAIFLLSAYLDGIEHLFYQ